MANANKIDPKANGIDRFLPAEIKDIDAITDFYNLEEELIKTKKNKNILLYTSILLFFTLVIGSSLYLTQTVEQKSKDFEININDFEDLRLKDVIDSAKRNENNLDLAKIQLDIIKINKNEALLSIQKQFYQNEIDILSLDLDNQETNIRIAKNKNTEVAALEKKQAEFQTAIQTKEAEIYKITSELAESEDSAEDQRSEFINNIDKLNAMNSKKLKEGHDSGIVALKKYYETYVEYIVLKYNPVFKSKSINNIMENEKGIVNHFRYLDSYDDFLLYEGVFTLFDFKNFRTKIDEFFKITNRLDRIPYLNSIKPAINKINDLTYSISHDYENLIGRIKKVVESKNDIIAIKNSTIDQRDIAIRSKSQAITALRSSLILKSVEIEERESVIRSKEQVIVNKNNSLQVYQNALAALMLKNTEGGFILQVQKNTLDIYVNPTYLITSGMTASIFRKDDEYIGEVKIKLTEGDTTKAIVIGLAKNKTVLPFDKLIFKF